MTVEQLEPLERRRRLRQGGLAFVVGPFIVRLRSKLAEIEESVSSLYGGYPVHGSVGAHFDVRVDCPSLSRRIVRPQVQFYAGALTPFLPLPRSMAPLVLEGGLNWCIGRQSNKFIVIHSATLERYGRAVLMPAPPGSGKSTLCAALVGRGWRLLSDEFGLIDPDTGCLTPVPRPVALKDGSIEVIRQWMPDAVFGPMRVNSEGQTVAYLRAPAASIADAAIPARPALVIVPQYIAHEETSVALMTPARATLHLADSSFNYNFHGRKGFDSLANIADVARAVVLRYSNLDEGVDAVEQLLMECA